MIIGAGFSGLLAAHVFQKMPIIEAGKQGQTHRAVLRFRTDSVSRLTGIEFKEVMVRKGIWYRDQFVGPNIQIANMYAMKCLGRIAGERSIWNVDPVKRYVAPEDFYMRLIDSVGARIKWETPARFLSSEIKINTAPLPVVVDSLQLQCGIDKFERAPIYVMNYHVPKCNAHQTIYFPDSTYPLYRATITGALLSIEFANTANNPNSLPQWQSDLEKAFNLRLEDCEEIGAVKQSYGKIAEIDNRLRQKLIYRLTNDFGIYSVGRFATWRNILLDDVVEDLMFVKKMISATDYDKSKLLS